MTWPHLPNNRVIASSSWGPHRAWPSRRPKIAQTLPCFADFRDPARLFDKSPGSQENEAVPRLIREARPDILIVGFGMPAQERWLAENQGRIAATVTMTGGAVFDYLSGQLQRGPRLLTENGYEWLARLLIEPRRLWQRYLVGNPLFLWRVLLQRKFPNHPQTK